MKLNSRQAHILKKVNDKYVSLDELKTQISTDPERREIAYPLPTAESIVPDLEENAREVEEWKKIIEAENNN